MLIGTCVALPTKKTFVSDQIDNCKHLHLSIFPVGYSVILLWLRTFPLNHNLARQTWASWCTSMSGKATAVSVLAFKADPVAKSWKCGSRHLNLPFLVLQPKFFFAVVEGAGARTRLSKICSLALPCDNSRNTRHRTPFSRRMPAQTTSTHWPCYCSSYCVFG